MRSLQKIEMPKDKAKKKKKREKRQRSVFRLKTLRTIEEAALPNKTPLKKPVLTEV